MSFVRLSAAALVALAENPAVCLPTYLVDADPATLRADDVLASAPVHDLAV